MSNVLRKEQFAGSLGDDSTFQLQLPAVTGEGWVVVGENEERSHFFFAASSVTLVGNSSNVVTTDTNAKFCVFAATSLPTSGYFLNIKNRLGSEKDVVLNVDYL